MTMKIVISILILAFLATPAFAQSGKDSGKTDSAKGDFFIVTSIDLLRKQILLKRPTEVTELMFLEDATRSFEENGKAMRLSDLRAGDTVYITSRSNEGHLMAVTIRKGPMTLDVLRERYLSKAR